MTVNQAPRPAATGHADDNSEQTPRRHVGHGGRRECQRAKLRRIQLPIGQNPREHWKRRHRPRHAEEQHKAYERHTRWRESIVEERREREAAQQRHHDAAGGDGQRRFEVAANPAEVEVHADQKHVDDHTKLRERSQRGQR
jgi:hypothetical protein